MSATEKVAEKGIEAVAEVAETVSEEAEHFAQATRSLNAIKVRFGLLGVAIGSVTASFIAFKVAYTKAETKYNQIADETIAEMRQHYRDKELAREAEASKEDLEDIVRERGYVAPEEESSTPPMAVSPPARVVEEVKDEIIEAQPGPGVVKEPELRESNVWDEHGDKPPAVEWDRQAELARRSPDEPYVIHYDERHEFDYEEVTLTYFTADDVLCRDRDEVIDPRERERLVGEENLERFGHGSNDHNVVYVRNDKLEMIFEILRSNNSYAEEVHGLAHGSGYGRNLERMRAKERRRPDDD